MVAIVSLHVLGAIGFAAVRRSEPPVADAKPIDVVLLQEEMQEHNRVAERIPVRLQELRVDLRPPEVLIPVADIQTPTAITPPPPSGPQQATVAAASGSTMAISALALKPPKPRYPPSAKHARAQGTVVLNVLIDTEGHVKDVLVHRTSGFQQLDAAACDAMWEALFRPYRENGVARSVRGTYEVRFSLNLRTASAS